MHQLTEDTDLAKGHEEALKIHLKRHFDRTKSKKAKEILEHFKENKRYFYFAVPKPLNNYHKGENIIKAISRKQMIEEMSIAIARNKAQVIVEAHKSGTDLFDGKIPDIEDTTSPLVSEFLVISGIWNRAIETAKKTKEKDIPKAAIKLILTEEKKFMDALYKDMKEALADYSDEALSHLLADKRVNDYKTAFSKREVVDTNALGSTVWILECSKNNAEHLKNYNSLEEELASQYLKIFIKTLAVA